MQIVSVGAQSSYVISRKPDPEAPLIFPITDANTIARASMLVERDRFNFDHRSSRLRDVVLTPCKQEITPRKVYNNSARLPRAN